MEYDDPGGAAASLEAGKRYLLLSHSYTDDEWYLRRNVADWVFMETNVQLDPWSLDILGNLIRYDQRANPDGTKYCRLAHDGEFTDDADGFVELAPDELIYSDPVTGVEVMNVDPDDFGRFSFAVDALKDTGEIMVEDPQQPGNWRPETVDYTQYNLPSIQELPDGVTAQEVIDSTSSWRMAMESIQTNNHSVPVLAVDSVEGMLEFASGRTQITQGRSISQEEYRDGAGGVPDLRDPGPGKRPGRGGYPAAVPVRKGKKPGADHGRGQRPDGILLPAAKGLSAGDGVYHHWSVSPEQRVERDRGQLHPQLRADAQEKRYLRHGDGRLCH